MVSIEEIYWKSLHLSKSLNPDFPKQKAQNHEIIKHWHNQL